MKRKLLNYFSFCLICLLLITNCSKREKLYTVGIIQIAQASLLDKAREGVIQAFKDSSFVDGKNIKINYQNAQNEIPNINLILQQFVQDKVDLIITIGSPCLVSACNFVKDIPVVSTASFHPTQLGIKEIPPNITGTYDPFDMDDFIKLIKEALPDVKRIGVPWNPSESNSRFSVEHLRKSAQKYRIELVEESVNNSSEVYSVTQFLATKRIEAIVVSTDNTVYSAFDSVVEVAEDNKIPIFITEPNNVSEGACAGFGIDLYDCGYKSGILAVRIMKGEKVENIPFQLLKHKRLYLNLPEAEVQGIKFAEDIIKKADKIIK